MKINLTKSAKALDGAPLFESKDSVGSAFAAYLMSISTGNPRELEALSNQMIANQPIEITEPQRKMLEQLVIGSNLMNILKIQLLNELELVEEEEEEEKAVVEEVVPEIDPA